MGRGWLVGVAVAVVCAGCYGPHVVAGAPCDPAQPSCPDGEVCVAQAGGYACEPPGTSGAIDGPVGEGKPFDSAIDARTIDGPPGDRDGDGVPDSTDNCPDVANPDQYNEDGDRFGDACDPCPPIADDNPPDADGDGVADACDPHPNATGDHIVLFEGFHAGVPAGWITVGAWTAANDSVSWNDTTSVASLTTTPALTGHETVTAEIVVNGVAGNADASAGVVDDYDHTNGPHGLYCHVTDWGTSTPLAVVELRSHNPHTTSYRMNAGETYTLSQRRDTTAFACHGVQGANTADASLTSTYSAATPEVGIRISDTKATFHWLMVVEN